MSEKEKTAKTAKTAKSSILGTIKAKANAVASKPGVKAGAIAVAGSIVTLAVEHVVIPAVTGLFTKSDTTDAE